MKRNVTLIIKKMFKRTNLFLGMVWICLSCQYTSQKTTEEPASEGTATVISDAISENTVYELKIDSVFPASQRRIPMQIINHSDDTILVGRNEYKLKYYNDNSRTWENALPEGHVYLLIADLVAPHDTLDLSFYEYTGNPGRYKVTKPVTVSKGTHKTELVGMFSLQ